MQGYLRNDKDSKNMKNHFLFRIISGQELNYQMQRIEQVIIPSQLLFSRVFSQIFQTYRFCVSLLTSIFPNFHSLSSTLLSMSLFRSLKSFDPRHKTPLTMQCLSFQCWQTPTIPQSTLVIFRYFSSQNWSILSLVFKSCKGELDEFSQTISIREQLRESNMSQKQGKQFFLCQLVEKTDLKQLQRSSFRSFQGAKGAMRFQDILMISWGMTSSDFLLACSTGLYSQISNSGGTYSLRHMVVLPQISSNQGFLEICSYFGKRVYLDLRNFSSKTNLQHMNSSQAMIMLRKLFQKEQTSECQFICESSLAIQVLILLIRDSYLIFLILQCPVKYRQNSSSKGNRVDLSSKSISIILEHMQLSYPHKFTAYYSSLSLAWLEDQSSLCLGTQIPIRSRLAVLAQEFLVLTRFADDEVDYLVLLVQLALLCFQIKWVWGFDQLLEFILQFGYLYQDYNFHRLHVSDLIVKSRCHFTRLPSQVRCALLVITE